MRYAIELGIATLTYAAVLAGTILLLQHHAAPSWFVLAPMLPALGVAWAILRQLRRIDEMQRRLQLEAIAVSFAATALITFGYGFLEGVGYPKLSMFVVWPLMATMWVLALGVGMRRYR